MSGFEKSKQELPSKENFYILLAGKPIRDKEYEHVLKVWDRTGVKLMKDYRDFCFICDVLLLASVFEKFRNRSLKNYGLCTSFYLSAPALS